jgi:hypothetical protein
MIYVATHDQAKRYKSRVLREAKQRGLSALGLITHKQTENKTKQTTNTNPST